MLTFLKQSVTDMIWKNILGNNMPKEIKIYFASNIICEARIYRVWTNSIKSKVLLEAKQTGGGNHLPLFISHLLWNLGRRQFSLISNKIEIRWSILQNFQHSLLA